MITFTITRPDDWHVHLRDGNVLVDTVRDISQYNGRALIMPNTEPPIITTAMASSYRTRILDRNSNPHFKPLMTLYLTDNTSAKEIQTAKASGIILASKLYLSRTTTNAYLGVTAIKNIYSPLEKMEELGIPLLIHGEIIGDNIDIFDREKAFLSTVIPQIINNFSNLKIVLEHITTSDSIDFVKNANDNVAATITAHHLLYNRNHMLAGGIKPHFYCLPVLKRNTHQQALIQAATSGNKKFFLGSDSAPHSKTKKESACGCAGLYTAHAALELYTEVFEKEGRLKNLEAFASHNGADFYGIKRNPDTIKLVKETWFVKETFPFGKDDVVVPIRSGSSISWKVKECK
ncbi:dihydroorotase [Candidatus Photodesmus katoptron]|uniref:Dihydroorotase n=1 Tax=Candidatus Photodesmus katoptron Akat1 TaxID=1236703 RepID=S3DG82_9GAMM|nr:dihydroorotase [Candidatus Photodesmus katoptron]EPE37432.1 dihydroorotase, homodimeric type [Candidatus Photodesmus katoptron Akat1]KEY90159.1 dihydroorotase [Candidatus Photodesmus katoptron]